MSRYKPIYCNSERIKEIVDSYGETVVRHVNSGWTPYILSFMFRHIYGKPDRVRAQMEDEIYRVYKGILRRSLKYPSTRKNQDRVSVWICCPDWPVPKGEKSSLQDVTINNGLHYHGIGLQPLGLTCRKGWMPTLSLIKIATSAKIFLSKKSIP